MDMAMNPAAIRCYSIVGDPSGRPYKASIPPGGGRLSETPLQGDKKGKSPYS